MIGSLVFWGFSGFTLLAATLVILVRNPVHAMLCLIVTLFNAAGVVLTLGAEYVAFIMIIVYGGAVAVLFLFVVMMLDIDHRTVWRGTYRDLPAMGVVIGLLLGEILALASTWVYAPKLVFPLAIPDVENSRALGRVLYTDYAFAFEIAGAILLVATVGSVLLTHRRPRGVKRQNVRDQIARRPDDALELRAVQTGEGVLEEEDPL
jgi:NADH-quinone oxidoreductase subunit J